MDDYGNTDQTTEWLENCEQYSVSLNTFGMFDDVSVDICWFYCIDWAAQEI